jgi:hypothetical protein
MLPFVPEGVGDLVEFASGLLIKSCEWAFDLT